MLTLEDVEKIRFKKTSIGGYRIDEVDDFIDSVLVLVSNLTKENNALKAKIDEATKILEKFNEEKETINTNKINSELIAEKTIKDANAKAEIILDNAKAEADRILADANSRIDVEKEMILKLENDAAAIREKLIGAFEMQIEALKDLPEKEEVSSLKNELDEKYPTEKYSDHEEAATVKEETFSTIEEAVEDATAETAETVVAVAETANASVAVSEDGVIQIEKSVFESRFGKLKFGDDYDVKSDS